MCRTFLPSWHPRFSGFCRLMQTPAGWNQRTRPHQRCPAGSWEIVQTHKKEKGASKIYSSHRKSREHIRAISEYSFTHKFVSRYGFLKLAIIRSPDFDEFISSWNKRTSVKSMNYCHHINYEANTTHKCNTAYKLIQMTSLIHLINRKLYLLD